MSDVPAPPPFGFSLGPRSTTSELIARFVTGARDGFSPAAQVEGAVLVRGDEPLAIRLDDAMLVRDQVPEGAAPLRTALCRVLSHLGMTLVEPDTPLALVVESEVFARRGYEWGLWAHDPEQGRAALAARAAGDMPGILETHDTQQRDRTQLDAVLREIEEQL